MSWNVWPRAIGREVQGHLIDIVVKHVYSVFVELHNQIQMSSVSNTISYFPLFCATSPLPEHPRPWPTFAVHLFTSRPFDFRMLSVRKDMCIGRLLSRKDSLDNDVINTTKDAKRLYRLTFPLTPRISAKGNFANLVLTHFKSSGLTLAGALLLSQPVPLETF